MMGGGQLSASSKEFAEMNPEPPARPHGSGRLAFGERDDDATSLPARA